MRNNKILQYKIQIIKRYIYIYIYIYISQLALQFDKYNYKYYWLNVTIKKIIIIKKKICHLINKLKLLESKIKLNYIT